MSGIVLLKKFIQSMFLSLNVFQWKPEGIPLHLYSCKVEEVFKLPLDRFYTNVNIQITIVATVSRGHGNLKVSATNYCFHVAEVFRPPLIQIFICS